MPSHALPREAAVFVEASLAEAQADWDANATEIFVIEPDVTGVTQGNLDSENIRPRRTFVHDMIRALKSDSTFTTQIYMTASGVNAADQAQAVATIQSDIMLAALGGRKLGFRADISGGTAAAPQITTDPGFQPGDWIFAFDTSAGVGEFARIETITGVGPFDLNLLFPLSFTPDGTDVAHAVIMVYPGEAALNDHSDANHTTLGWLVQGEGAPDVFELRGCKPAMELEGITAGEPVKATFEHGVVDWTTAPPKETFTTAPAGIAPTTVGTGKTAKVKIADFGVAPADVDTRGTLTVNFGIGWDQDRGPNGCEGVHGYVATGVGEGGPQLTVDDDNVYDTDWRDEVKKNLYVQVGDQTTDAWGVYWPRLEYRATPTRVDEGGLTSAQLDFRAQEDTASITGLAGDEIEKRRAPFMIMIVA